MCWEEHDGLATPTETCLCWRCCRKAPLRPRDTSPPAPSGQGLVPRLGGRGRPCWPRAVGPGGSKTRPGPCALRPRRRQRRPHESPCSGCGGCGSWHARARGHRVLRHWCRLRHWWPPRGRRLGRSCPRGKHLCCAWPGLARWGSARQWRLPRRGYRTWLPVGRRGGGSTATCSRGPWIVGRPQGPVPGARCHGRCPGGWWGRQGNVSGPGRLQVGHWQRPAAGLCSPTRGTPSKPGRVQSHACRWHAKAGLRRRAHKAPRC